MKDHQYWREFRFHKPTNCWHMP